jgi:type II secretory pathway component PulC
MNFKEIALIARSEQIFDSLGGGFWRRIIGSASVIQKILSLILCLMIISLMFLVTSVERKPLDMPTVPQTRLPPANSWNWFTSSFAPKPVFRENKVLPEASINADLLGILITSEIATATIKYAGMREKVYLKGDRLGTNMIISEIEPNRVIIEGKGSKEQITLKRPESIFESTLDLDNKKVGLKEGFAIANMFGAVPVSIGSQDGNFDSGYRLNSLSTELRSLADVEDGDVIVAVDGLAVNELIKNSEDWKKFALESNLPVKVIRDGREVIVYVNAASLAQKMLPMLGKIDY